MSSRLPRPAASNSIASVMREAPPVSTTMPSALRSSATSSVGTRQMNHRNPSPSEQRHDRSTATNVDQPMRRSSGGRARARRPGDLAGSAVIGAWSQPSASHVHPGVIIAQNSAAGGGTGGGASLTEASAMVRLTVWREVAAVTTAIRTTCASTATIAQHPDREAAEQGRELVARRPRRRTSRSASSASTNSASGAAAADRAALQSQAAGNAAGNVRR